MECLWCMHCDRAAVGHFHQQDPPVFYVHFNPHHGFSYHYLYDTRFLEKYQEVYLGG